MTQAKADPLIDQLDPNKCVQSRFYRDSCISVGGTWIKDLRKLENKDFFQKVVFVDDEEANYILYKQNVLAISPWQYGDTKD
jgi:TFIIF-interacting CTD phosphatase-like protein